MSRAHSVLAGIARYLRGHRRGLSVVAALALVYALAGFLLAPWILGRQLIAFAQTELGRRAEVRKIEVNPFALSVRMQGLGLKDPDDSRLLGLDDLVVNFEMLESLFRRAWTFSEMRLGGPYLKLVRDRAGHVNLMSLLPPSEEEPEQADAAGLPRLVVRRFQLGNGVIDLEDQVPEAGFGTRIGPFGVDVDEFSTLPDAAGRQNVTISLESGARIAWTGDLVVTPLRSEGQFTLQGPFLGIAHRYARDQLKFTVGEGSIVEASARYRLAGTKDGGLEAAISDAGATVRDVRLTAAHAPDFLRWSELRVAGGAVRWPAREASIGSVMLSGLKIVARREPDGAVNVEGLLTPESEPLAADTAAAAVAPAETPDPAAGSPPAWTLRIAAFGLRDMAVDLTDAGTATPAALAVSDLDLTLGDLSNQPGARSPLEASLTLGGGGTIRLKGTIALRPEFALDTDLQADGLKLDQAQPYVSDVARIGIRDGALAIDGHLASDATEALAFQGDMRIVRLDTRDLLKNKDLLAWSELALDDMQVLLTGRDLRVARARFTRPFGRIFIERDKTTNIGALMVEQQPPVVGSAPAATAAPEKPFRVRIGKVVVNGGETDFTDLSLPLPFAARIRELKGELTTIDSGSAAPSRIALEGRVDEYGLARVNGQVRMSSPTDSADIGVVFRNIEMPPLSPYTVEFAGRKIARGKVDLDLNYKLDKRKLDATNRIVIDELELGEKVPNPNAIDLPLGLAVALLKDANGRIDVDMPVSGDLDDPEFGIGKVIWKAFVNLITKVATAPFRLLGSLIGVESEDFGRIEFSPGRGDLLPPAREQLTRIAEALGKRPSLGVEIPAVVDPTADAAVLRAEKMQSLVDAELARSGRPGSERGLEKRTRKAVEAVFERQFPDQSLDDIRKQFEASPPDDPAGRRQLDELAYLDELRDRIAAVQTVEDGELAALGTARAAAIGAALTESGQVAPDRVRTGQRKDVKARDGAWIPAELTVSSAGQQ
jgi:hypothetical protein